MIKLDEASLICDFAETYHIYDYRSLPVGLASTLAFGLGDDSRIKMKLSGQRAKTSVLLLASIADGIHLLLWSASKAGTPKPKLFTEILMNLCPFTCFHSRRYSSSALERFKGWNS